MSRGVRRLHPRPEVDCRQAAGFLHRLDADGLLSRTGERFRYSPPDEEVERAVDGVAESYASYRVAVIGLIFSKPGDHVRDFPEAFRLRRPKD